MKNRVMIKDLNSHIGKEVETAGFARAIRDQGNVKFLMVSDISGEVQAVVLKNHKEAYELFKKITLESVISVKGLVKSEKQAPGGMEIEAKNIEILSLAEPELPIPVYEKGEGETSLDKRLDWRFLDLRKSKNALIIKIWTLLEAGFRNYWTDNNYLEIHSPKFMASASESGADVFEVKYFNRKAYLAQSPQFYKQMAMAAGLERVFEVGPVFRAEPSFTSRHATEFIGFDAEISYINSYQDVIKELEETIHRSIVAITKTYALDIKKHFNRELPVPKLPFPQLSMKEAKKILAKLKVPNERDGDLSPEEERQICEYVKEKYHHEFVFITDYPVSVRPFYHMRHKDDQKLTCSFDLLWNGVEITTGAQREHRYEVLVKQAQEKGLDLKGIKFYLDFFKYGCPAHGGYGLGPARMIIKIFNLENVREATYLYRGVKRLEP